MNNEDPKAFDILLNFRVRIEDNSHYSEKQEYIQLLNEFLADQISADDFLYSFLAIYEGINNKLRQMEINESLELGDFLKSSRLMVLVLVLVQIRILLWLTNKN